jgi:hypothetical protein
MNCKKFNVLLTELAARIDGKRHCTYCRILRDAEGGAFIPINRNNSTNCKSRWLCAACYRNWTKAMRKVNIRLAAEKVNNGHK